MKGEVVSIINNGSVTSIRIAAEWTDEHDPIVVDIPFLDSSAAFQSFIWLSNIFQLNEQVVWSNGCAMRQQNKLQTQGEYHASK